MYKKTFAFLLMFCLCFTYSPGFAEDTGEQVVQFNDVTGTEYEPAIKELISLGVLSGYEDGKYKPDESISENRDGTVIEWESSDTKVIATDGTVTRPSGNEPALVTLTATITKGADLVVRSYAALVYPAGAAGETIHFIENFEDFPVQIGQNIADYNGWWEYTATTVIPFPLPAPEMNIYTIEEDPLIAGNNVGQIDCAYPRHVGYEGSAWWNVMYRTLDEPILEGIYSVRLKANLANVGCENFLLRLSGTTAWDINITPSDIIPGKGNKATYSKEKVYNSWRDIELVVDIENEQLTILEGGRQLEPPQVFPKPTFEDGVLNGVAIGTPRTTNTFNLAKFYFDDIVVSSYDDAYVVDKAAGLIGNFDSVTENLPLYQKIYGADVTWSSDKPDVLNAQGEVTRPIGTQGEIVTLTANISRGEEQAQKIVIANILPTAEYEITKINVQDGVISDITVKKNNPSENARIFVAVYNGNMLQMVEIFIMGAPETEVIPLSIPISDESTFKVFIWDKNTLRPLSNRYMQ